MQWVQATAARPVGSLVSLAELPVPTVIKEDPFSPDDDPRGVGTAIQNSPMEITLVEDVDHAGLAEADLTVQSEQRAMQDLRRFQKHSLLAMRAEGVERCLWPPLWLSMPIYP